MSLHLDNGWGLPLCGLRGLRRPLAVTEIVGEVNCLKCHKSIRRQGGERLKGCSTCAHNATAQGGNRTIPKFCNLVKHSNVFMRKMQDAGYECPGYKEGGS